MEVGILKFQNAHRALVWYCNKTWLSPPKPPGNHSPIKRDGGFKTSNIHSVFDTFIRITNAMKKLPARDMKIVLWMHTRGVEAYEIAKWFRISERRVRQIRNEYMDFLNSEFSKEGLITNGPHDPLPPFTDNGK